MRINLIEKISTVTIVLITFALFIAAIFSKGLTHDVFLEAGVFLISVKIIYLTLRTNSITRKIQKQLESMNSLLLNKMAPQSPKASDDET